jgi:fatty acid desaturase
MTACVRARIHTLRVISLRPTSAYATELKPALPARAFEPARSRLLWLPVHLATIALGTFVIATRSAPTWSWPLVSLAIGCAFAGLAFVAHETMHGAIVRGKRLRHLVGFVAFVPFVLSPRLWVAWHNRMHHGHANHPGVDPDAYPTLSEHRQSLLVRLSTDCFGIGRGRFRGLTSLFIGFHAQSFHMLLAAWRRRYLSRREFGLALVESGVGATLWLSVLFALGARVFLFAYVLPALVANACVMGYIFTNHALSPHTSVNDPLANSLSVTVPRVIDFFTLRFGFHVEHHLFPWMSSRHAPVVRDLVRARWPERYQSMPLWRALLAVHVTPRVYEDPRTLVDPRTGFRVRTLMARVRERLQGSARPSARQ